jgi:hypothetical protein
MNLFGLRSHQQARIVYRIALIIALFFLLTCSPGNINNSGLVNLAHLNYLCEDVTWSGHPTTIVHIYCNHPEYLWTDASGEGITCVDDVARAIVVYIKACELNADTLYAPRIRRLLNLVLSMQTEDGEFYNFIHKDFTINCEGRTSRKSFSFWAARGYWALGTSYRFFKEKDPEYAVKLRRRFRRCFGPLDTLMLNYQQYEKIDGRTYPTWLINRYASDATSELLLGVSEYLQVEYDSQLAIYAQKLAEGIMAMQIEEHDEMRGAFESWPGYWHAWGNAQVQALARLSKLIERDDFLISAELSAKAFLSKLIVQGLIHEFDFKKSNTMIYPQIAYDIRTTALGFLELYQVTKNIDYAVLAGLSASWLTGDNGVNQPMYDPSTGRGYDGINEKGVNLNAGAESTIEALYTLIEILKIPDASSWLRSKGQVIEKSNMQTKIYHKLFYNRDKNILVTWDHNSGFVKIQSEQLYDDN